MKFSLGMFWVLGLFACSKSAPPTVVGGDLKGEERRTIVEGAANATIGSSEEALQALYKELPLTEKVMPFMPKLSCAQTSLVSDREAGTSSMGVTCRLTQGRVEYKIDEGSTVSWTYLNATQPYTPTQSASETSPSARFDFSSPDPVMNLFLADTGKFSATVKYEGRSIPIETPKVQVVGEPCTKPLEGLINITQTGGYTIVTSRVGLGGDTAGRRFIVSGVNGDLSTDSARATIIAINSGKAQHNGRDVRAIVTDTASFTASNTPAGVFAGPFAIVSAPGNVFRFKTELGLCERQ